MFFVSLWLSLRAGRYKIRFPTEAGEFSVLQNVQTSSGAYLASLLRDTRVTSPGGKATGA